MPIAVAAFAVTFMVIFGTYWAFVLNPEEAETRAIRKRLKVRRAALLAPIVRAEARLSAVVPLERLLAKSQALAQPLRTLIERSGLKVTAGVIVLGSVFGAFVGFALVNTLTHLVLAALVAGVVLGALPVFYVRRAAAKRLAVFEEQFPEAVDLMARSLRAGHALTSALQLVGEEIQDPVGAEFRLLFDRQNFGMSLTDALKEFANRVPLLDARFFVTAVLIQRETGGNLSQVLDNLAAVIRERFKVQRQVRVMSAHGRITGWALGLMPPVLGLVLSFLSPDHMTLLLHDPLGIQMLTVAVILQVIGVLTIRKIVDVEY